MTSYTLDDARKLVLNCAKSYQNNLLDKSYLIIYKDKKDNKIKHIEIQFKAENYQHLTGVLLIDENGKERKHVAREFFKKCINNSLSKTEIAFKKDGTTQLKLAALPKIMNISKITRITGDYDKHRTYLIADKLIGNINFCLGLVETNGNFYIPNSALFEDIKKFTRFSSQVLAVFSKNIKDKEYVKIHHVAKNINLKTIKLPKEILNKISLVNYKPKL